MSTNDAVAYFQKGEAHYQNGNYRAAIDNFTKYIDFVADSVIGNSQEEALKSIVWCCRGAAYCEIGEYDNAIDDFSKAINLAGKRDMDNKDILVKAYLDRAHIYRKNRNIDNAIRDIRSVLGLDPDNAAAKEFLAIAQNMQVAKNQFLDSASKLNVNQPRQQSAPQSLDTAQNVVEQVIDTRQNARQALTIAEYFKRASTYCNRGDYDNAIDEYTAVIKFDPNNVDAYVGRGSAYVGRGNDGDYDRCISDCNMAMRLDPNNAKAYFFRGSAYSKIDANDQAIADYNYGIRLDPNNASVYFSRSCVYTKQGKYDLAIKDCDQAIRLDPNNVIAYIGRGVLYCDKKNRPDLAINDFNVVLRINPSNALAKLWLEKALQKL
ncbi:MAG: tetratricopeptide repeat protein [Chitinispirillales bacterium]|jgi:tetratricopeptide (TPR) repeat protein|nr:tetratricopeptide repeat protein [Chitinispirillales bacterium]